MPRNGSGTFIRQAGPFTGGNLWQTQAATTVDIFATDFDLHDQDMADAISASIAADGQTPITANLPMSGFRHTGVGAATAATDYARTDQVQRSSFYWGGTSTGSTNSYDVSANLSPAISGAAVAGQKFRFKAHQTNTAGATFTAGPMIAAVHIRRMSDATSQLNAGEIVSGQVVEVVYDGTYFRLQNPVPAVDPITQAVVQTSSYMWGGTSTGSSGNYAITLSPAPAVIPAGTIVRFIANHSTPGISSLNVNGLGVTGIGYGFPVIADIRAGAIVANQIVECIYDGLRFHLLNPAVPPLTAATTWAPSVTQNAGTWGSASVPRARYWLDAHTKTCRIELVVKGNAAATDVNYLTIPLPVAAYSSDSEATVLSCQYYIGGYSLPPCAGRAEVNGSNLLVSRHDLQAFTHSVVSIFAVNGSYEYA